MVCFCHSLPPPSLTALGLTIVPGIALPAGSLPAASLSIDPLLPALHAWLSARWLPAAPWHPDPAWLDIELASPVLPAASLSVMIGLVEAAERCRINLGIDIFAPVGQKQLIRAVVTLNARMGAMASLAIDPAPLFALLRLEAQLRLVESAVSLNLLAPANVALSAGVAIGVAPNGPWRALLAAVMALAPVIALGQTLKLDWTAPAAMDQLAAKLRVLAQIQLPPLADLSLVLRLVAQFDAVVRLRASLGVIDIVSMQAVLEQRAQLLLAALPPSIRLEAGLLVGLPPLPPNPGLLLNAPTLQIAQSLTPALLARMRWRVPGLQELAMIQVATPVATLAGCLAALGANPIRLSPCASSCDAASLI